jgi:tetratricopeptide (TPR) repeat protein
MTTKRGQQEAMDRNAQGSGDTGTSTPTSRWERITGPLRRFQKRLDAAREQPAVVASGVIGLFLFTVGLGVVWSLVLAPKIVKKFDDEFGPVLAHLDEGEFEYARRGATLLREENWSFKQLGGPVYVLGVVMARDAAEHWDPLEQKNLYLVASRYIEESRDRGFPKGREEHAIYLLGSTMFRGGRLEESIPFLEKSLKLSDDYVTELHLLLTLAHLRQAAPDIEKANKHNELFLDRSDLEAHDRLQGLILCGEILLKLHRFEEAQTNLNELFVLLKPVLGSGNLLEMDRQPKIAQKDLTRWQTMASEAFVLESRVGLAWVEKLRADSVDAATIEAILVELKERLELARQRRLDSGPSNFLLGRIYEMLGDDDAALAEFILVRRKHLRADEGIAASINEAEILLRQAQPADAVDALKRVILDIVSTEPFHNRWLTYEELRSRLRVVYVDLIDNDNHDQAIAVADMSRGVFAESESLEMRADAQFGSGQSTALEAEKLPSNVVELRGKANQRFSAAGESYEELAKLRFATREYTEYLWKSATAFHNGKDYRSVVRVLRRYLGEESRKRRPHALTMLGEAQLAQGDGDAALRTLTDAISQYPSHPVTYRARLASALLHLERQDLKTARQLLNDNLENGVLTPRSRDWQESLFLLGQTYHGEGLEADRLSREAGIDSLDPVQQKSAMKHLEAADQTFERAARRLREYVLRAPTSRRAIQSEYMIAESLRFRAKLPRANLRLETIETVRANLARERQLQLEDAYDRYDKLIAELNRRQDLAQLTPIDLSVLRNCYFLAADTLFALDRFEDAITAYSSATNRYQLEPASLDAYLQIAACYRRLGNSKKARGSLEQARVVLAKMPVDLPFEQTSRFTRQQWELHLQ